METNNVQQKFGYIHDRRIDYTNLTSFLVQVGKGKKGSYRTKYEIVGNLSQAMFYYSSINVGLGYKKRLLMPTSLKPVLARCFS